MLSKKSFETIKKELFSYSLAEENNIKKIFTLITNHNNCIHDSLFKIISHQFLNYSNTKKNTYEKYDIDNELRFNFFESISDKWYRENFHSDIFEAILNPNTPEIGNKEFLKQFLSFLNISKEQFDYDSNFTVIKEAPTGIIKWKDNQNNKREKEGFIDLLIKNEHQAIIIENKINYAPDMENQLVRYMKYVEENLKISQYVVVYLTLIDDKNKKPPLDSYDKDFEKYTKKLKQDNILKEVFAVDPQKSIAKTFLPACQSFLSQQININHKNILDNACNIAFVYLEQYRVLLNHLGGIAYMTTVDKKIFEEIYSNEELYYLIKDFVAIWNEKDNPKRPSDKKFIEEVNVNKNFLIAADDFYDLWSNRWNEIVDALMVEKFKSTFNNLRLELKKINGYLIYSWLSQTNDFRIYWDGDFQVGYVSLDGKTFSKSKEKELKKKLMSLIGTEIDNIGEQGNQWLWFDIPNSNFSSLDDVIKYLGILLNN